MGVNQVKFWRIENSSRWLELWNLAASSYLLLVVVFILGVMTAPSVLHLANGPILYGKDGPAAPNPAHSAPGKVAPASAASADRSGPAGAAPDTAGGSDLADAGPAASAAPGSDARGTSFIPLDFSLPQAGQAEAGLATATDGSIKVRKLVQAGTNEVGAIDITIDRNSLLFIDAGDARQVLAGNDAAMRKLDKLPASGLVSFKAMRDRGIDFRYDPNRDLITVEVR